MPHDPNHPREFSFDELETAMLLTERQVAEQLHIKRCTVRNERLHGAISYVRIRSRFYYTQEQVDDYIQERTIQAGSHRSEQPELGSSTVAPSASVTRMRQKDSGPSDVQKQVARARIEEILRHPPRKPR